MHHYTRVSWDVEQVYCVIFDIGLLRRVSEFAILALCVGNSPVTGEFPTQRASNTDSVGNSPATGEFPTQWASNMENASLWRRHHLMTQVVEALPRRNRNTFKSHIANTIAAWWRKKPGFNSHIVLIYFSRCTLVLIKQSVLIKTRAA